jgi:hypothetical protein
MMQILGTLAIILPIVLAVSAAGFLAFNRSINAHEALYRYEQTHVVEELATDDRTIEDRPSQIHVRVAGAAPQGRVKDSPART